MWRNMEWVQRLARDRERLIEEVGFSFRTALHSEAFLSWLTSIHTTDLTKVLGDFGSGSIMELLGSHWATWRKTAIPQVGSRPLSEPMFAEIEEAVSRMVNSQSRILHPETFALTATLEAWHQSMESPTSTIAFRDSFAANMLDMLSEAGTAESDNEFERAANNLATQLGQRADDLPASKASNTGVWLWVASTLLSFWMFVDQRQTNERLYKRLDAIGQSLASIEERRPLLRPQSRMYVASRAIVVRNGPSKEFDVVARVHPNTILSVKSREGGWLEVDYFDFIKFESSTGWVYKRNLKVVDWWQDGALD